MSARGDDRGYKVVYSNRGRDLDPLDDQIPRHRAGREYDYDYDYDYRRDHRDYRDDRTEIDRRVRPRETRGYPPPTAPLPPVGGGTTKTTYEIARDRNSEAYVKRSNALIIDRPRDRGRAEYEVLRPERRDDGAYIVDIGARRSRDYVDRDMSSYDAPSRAKYYDLPPRRDDDVIMYDTSNRAGRDRAMSYKDVQIVEEVDDDPRYRPRGRSPETYVADAAAPSRLRSSMRGRNDSPPELIRHRRSQSVGFYKDQISHHDASESRHERPGAEAHVAGKYLVGHGQYDDVYVDDSRRRDRSRSRGRHGPKTSEPRLKGYDYDDERRTHTEDTLRDYEYEDDQRPAYPPQRGYSRRRHHRHRHDDDRSNYSEYDVEVKKTKEYY